MRTPPTAESRRADQPDKHLLSLSRALHIRTDREEAPIHIWHGQTTKQTRDDFRLRSACAAQRFGRTVMPTGLLVVVAPALSVARAVRTWFPGGTFLHVKA